MATPSPWLQNLTWEDIEKQIEVAQGTIIIPVGSTEQHGPHLPVGTDTMVANTLADDAAYMSKSIIKEMGWGAVGHAEEIEGSHMWYRYPDKVKMGRAVDNPHPSRKLYSVDPSYPDDTLCYVPSSKTEMAQSVEAAGGTTGEPSKASPEGGKRYHEHLVKRLVEVIEMLQQT